MTVNVPSSVVATAPPVPTGTIVDVGAPASVIVPRSPAAAALPTLSLHEPRWIVITPVANDGSDANV